MKQKKIAKEINFNPSAEEITQILKQQMSDKYIVSNFLLEIKDIIFDSGYIPQFEEIFKLNEMKRRAAYALTKRYNIKMIFLGTNEDSFPFVDAEYDFDSFYDGDFHFLVKDPSHSIFDKNLTMEDWIKEIDEFYKNNIYSQSLLICDYDYLIDTPDRKGLLPLLTKKNYTLANFIIESPSIEMYSFFLMYSKLQRFYIENNFLEF